MAQSTASGGVRMGINAIAPSSQAMTVAQSAGGAAANGAASAALCKEVHSDAEMDAAVARADADDTRPVCDDDPEPLDEAPTRRKSDDDITAPSHLISINACSFRSDAICAAVLSDGINAGLSV